MGFSFTATAQCDLCGAYLSSSDEECDHEGENVTYQMFRRIGTDELLSVEASDSWKWQRLEELRDDWIAYQWLGSKERVKSFVSTPTWDGPEDVPHLEMSVDADISDE